MLTLCTFTGVNPSEYAHLYSNQFILDIASNKLASWSETACRDSVEILRRLTILAHGANALKH